MPDNVPKTIPIPREGLSGIQALIDLGEECLKKLGELQSHEKLDLSFSDLFDRWSSQLKCDRQTLEAVVLSALVPLNGLRRNLGLASSEFVAALEHTISATCTEDWKEKHLETWKRIASQLGPFFEPDNFFAQVSKAFDLLVERPAILQGVRVLTELRPIFNEETTKTLALLQTNTLALDYRDGDRVTTLHITMDSDDLARLESELARARTKIEVSKQEAIEKKIHIVAYGEPR